MATKSPYKVAVLPYYEYEVTLYKLWKGRAELVGISYYKLKSPIKEYCQTAKVDDYILTKEVILIGAPLDYIQEHKLFNESNRKSTKSSRGDNSTGRRNSGKGSRKRT